MEWLPRPVTILRKKHCGNVIENLPQVQCTCYNNCESKPKVEQGFVRGMMKPTRPKD